jgi:hypothetical protein
MLPPLGTPFRARDLDANLERFLPIKPPPPLPIDVDESLCNGWLELWYQSKIDPQTLVPQGAVDCIDLVNDYALVSASAPSLHSAISEEL